MKNHETKTDYTNHEAIIRELYLNYYEQLYGYGMAIYPNQQVIRDAIQDIFLWLWEHPEKLRQIQQISHYLFTALRRNIYEIQKHSNWKKEKERINQHQFNPESNDLPIEYDWLAAEQEKDYASWLAEKIVELSPRHREVLYLHFYQGFGYEEIAKINNTSNQVVRNYVSLAIKKLRQLSKSFRLY